jgi:biopolymer transport protein ExbB
MLELVEYSLRDFFEKGGAIMWPILGVSLIVWFLCIERFFYLVRYSNLHHTILKAIQTNTLSGLGNFDNKTYSQLVKRLKNQSRLHASLEPAISGFQVNMTQDLNKHMSTIDKFIQVAPLLGLLGTVDGMGKTFSDIMQFGIGNPQLMAEGISMAMLTTQAGLTVAFPAMLFLNLIQARKNRLAALILKDMEFLKTKPQHI